MKKVFKICLTWALLLCMAASVFACNLTDPQQEGKGVVISEVCLSNGVSYEDEAYGSPDWIELHNESNRAVNLFGWGITDHVKNTDKACTLPEITIPADGYTGRAILYGDYQHGFGYFPSAYFDNASFAKLRLIPVRAPMGDVNEDDKLTAADAAAILRYAVGLSEWNEARRVTADLNGDQAVTAEDAAIVLRIVLGLEPMPEE